MILPRQHDQRFITIRRGGTLTDAHHQLLALWAAACAERVLPQFEQANAADQRLRNGICWFTFKCLCLQRLLRLTTCRCLVLITCLGPVACQAAALLRKSGRPALSL